ncbi:hypothetical protein RUM43_010731 [Polyplax serrata]|uniref:Uncharacterized protein n=1 Tax=Polyplax serrata TaxID=468196 RepID=A0AAN8Q575_POLSC
MGKFLVDSSATESSDDKKSSVPYQEAKIYQNDGLHIDSYYGPEVPPNVLFPDQLNKYLREQIQNLSLENGSLRRSLEEMQDEVNNAKQKLLRPSVPIAGRASEIAANKIAELSKKLRERNAELEGMKTRAKDAEAKLRQLEANASDQQLLTQSPPEDEISEKDKQIKSLTEKLQAANAKMCDFRNQCQALKQDMKLAQRVIESEVGEKVVFQDLAKENGNWRGRAQQIISLQNKIQHLQEQLSNTTVTESPAVNVLRQMEKDRRASYEETTKQLNQKTIQMEEMRKKLEASKARTKVLENEIIQVKTKLSSLVDKGIRDDQLVAALTSQINVFEDRLVFVPQINFFWEVEPCAVSQVNAKFLLGIVERLTR